MKAIQNYEDIENLKADDKLVELWNGDANYYRFLCFHPRNRNYVILAKSQVDELERALAKLEEKK